MKGFLAFLLLLILPPAVYFPTLGAKRDEELRRADAEVKDLDTHIEQASAAQRKLTQFREERARLDAELTKLRLILPPALAMDEIRTMSEAKAAANGVKLTRFEAAGVNPAARPEHGSVVAEVVGSAEGTAGFLRDLQNAARIIDVSYVTLRKDPAGWRTDFIMTCYAMPDAR